MIKKQIESKVLTVSEIAEKVDVTRNVVWSYIRRNKIKPVVKEKKNFKFDSEIVLKIKKEQKKKLSFKERKEFESLDSEIPQLEEEKARLEVEMSSGTLSNDQLLAKSERIAALIAEIDEKTMRWLELSEWA